VQELDKLLDYLKDGLDSLGIWDKLNVILTSDHGFTTMLKNPPQVDQITLNSTVAHVRKNRQIYVIDRSEVENLS
jgi:arylsulfatase A-like enzyme